MAMKERRELRHGGQNIRKAKSSETNSLSDLELTPDESSNAQVLASVSEDKLILMAMKERRELRDGRKEKRSTETTVNSSLSDLELTKDESSNAQVLASVSEEKLDELTHSHG